LKSKVKSRLQNKEINNCIKTINEKYENVGSLAIYEVISFPDDPKYKKKYVFHEYTKKKLSAFYDAFYYKRVRYRRGKVFNCEVERLECTDEIM